MGNPLTEAREWLADQLLAIPALAAAKVNLYGGPVEQITAPGVIITPGPEWLKVATPKRTAVGLEVTVAVTWTGGNAAALASLEALVWPILLAFPGGAVVLSPAVTRYGQADLYAATLTIPVLVTDDESETP